MQKRISYGILSTVLLLTLILGINHSVSAVEKNVNNILYPVSIQGSWGYINSVGKIIVKPQYVKADEFYDGVAIVQSNIPKGKVYIYPNTMSGVIDKNGKLIIKPTFTFISRFSENIAYATYVDSKSRKLVNCLINKQGKIITKLADYIHINSSLLSVIMSPFSTPDKDTPIVSEGLLVAYNSKNNLYGYMNTKGLWIIPAKYDDAAPFNNGLAHVIFNGKHKYIDKRGSFPINCDSYSEINNFSEGLALCRNKADGKVLYINTKGTPVITLDFPVIAAYGFHEGLSKISTSKDVITTQAGFIDKSGQYAVQPITDFDAYSNNFFQEGLVLVADGQAGYIDKTGKTVIPSIIDKTMRDKSYMFRGGIAKVILQNGKIGYINKSGKYVWEPQK